MGSYTTTNYSVTTAATSIISPNYHTKRHNHLRKSTLTKHDELNLLKEEEEHQRELELQHEKNINMGMQMHDDECTSELNLNLDEDDPSQFFKSLDKFRKSFIEKRRQSGIHDLDDQTRFTAPPTEKDEEEYHRRLHTLDLDEKIDELNLVSSHVDTPTDSTQDDDNKDKDDIAPPHDSDHDGSRQVHHAVEGSRELGIDDIGIINHVSDDDDEESKSISYQDEIDDVEVNINGGPLDENKGSILNAEMLGKMEKHGRSGSIKWAMSRDRESSKIFVSGAILNGSDDDKSVDLGIVDNVENGGIDSKHIKKVSISKKRSIDGRDEEEVQFEIDIGPEDDDMDDDDEFNDTFDNSEFMRLTDHFSVKRELQGPRGSMKVSRISVSDELAETLKHQTQITGAPIGSSSNTDIPIIQPQSNINNNNNVIINSKNDNINNNESKNNDNNNNNNNQNKDPNDPSPPTSLSSFDNQHQADVERYVKRVSLTPRGIDPDNATVSVMFSNAANEISSRPDIVSSPMLHYKDREFLKSKNNQHRRTDSMDTQPDNNDQAPYINKQLTTIIKNEINENERKMNEQENEANNNKFPFPANNNKDEESPGPPNLGSQGSVLIRQESAQFYDHGHDDIGLEFNGDIQMQHPDQPSMLHMNEHIDDVQDMNLKEDSVESSQSPNDGIPETNEGWEQPTGYEEQPNGDIQMDPSPNLLKTPRSYNDNDSNIMHNEEKYDQLLSPRMNNNYSSDDEDDGYQETTRGGPSMMTMGGNMLNVLRFIPWNENEYLPQELDESYDERTIPRFNVNQTLNEIIRFHWNGDALLKSDAIVIPITEDWTPISAESHMLMNNAGSEYLEWIYQNKKLGDYISTGDAQECSPFNLPCKYIIHTSPPRYDDRYPVASENAMNSCYWRSLEIACDLQCKTIVFPSIYPPKFFSEQLAIHILSRTLRRFLERYQSVSFQSVVICVDNEDQMQLYTRIFTIYFPRDNIDLKYSQKYMPAYTGNISGGTVVKLRRQNIELSPLINPTQNINANRLSYLPNNSNIALIHKNHIDYETYDIYGNLRPAIQSMVECKVEPEKIWKAQENKKWGWQKVEESFEIRYKRYWNRCRKLNLHQIQMHQFVYVGGKDRDDRDIIIFVGNRFPAKQLMQQKKLKQSLLYIIRELHHIVDRDYVVIYLHSKVNEEENLPPISWINQCFQICGHRFHKNLHKFFVIHPNFRLKSWFYVLSTKSFYQKIVYLDSMTKLEHHNIDLEHIALPGKSWEYERELFGEDKLVDKMALASDDLVLDALPYR